MGLFNVSFIGAGNVAERLVTNAGGLNVGGSTVTTAGTITLPTNRVLRLTNMLVNFQGAAGVWRIRQTNLTGNLVVSLFFAAAGQQAIDRLESPLQIVSGATAGVLVVTEAGVASANEATITGKIE